ncbi:MAG TPA: class II aldolase/adducin family protein [Gemmatimonas sp.]|nr:class II aldolase/adducin family protein [Gemmatimonas sp.]
MADACRRLHARGLLAGAEGNISVRLPDGSLLVTPSGVDKAEITASDILHLHSDGTAYHAGTLAGESSVNRRDIARRPSSELGMHRACYDARTDVFAVVHAHPPAATGLGTAGQTLPADVLPELPVIVGPVAMVPYGRPGTPALGEAMAPFLRGHDAFLLANHGVTTVGGTLKEALLRLETVEQAARILVVARLLGGERRLEPDEARALASLRTGPESSFNE